MILKSEKVANYIAQRVGSQNYERGAFITNGRFIYKVTLNHGIIGG